MPNSTPCSPSLSGGSTRSERSSWTPAPRGVDLAGDLIAGGERGSKAVLLATTSHHKALELGRLLGRPVEPLPGYVAPPEHGASFLANARIKARAGRAQAPADAVVLADDSGLCVDALGGAPGVLSARFGGEGLDDRGRLTHLLALVAGRHDRGAQFVCVLVAIDADGHETVVEGHVDGTITEAPRGTGGFGYDPIFIPAGASLTTAEMAPTEKDAVSHRGRAARSLAAALGW